MYKIREKERERKQRNRERKERKVYLKNDLANVVLTKLCLVNSEGQGNLFISTKFKGLF